MLKTQSTGTSFRRSLDYGSIETQMSPLFTNALESGKAMQIHTQFVLCWLASPLHDNMIQCYPLFI